MMDKEKILVGRTYTARVPQKRGGFRVEHVEVVRHVTEDIVRGAAIGFIVCRYRSPQGHVREIYLHPGAFIY